MALKPADFAPDDPIYSCSCFGTDETVRKPAEDIINKLAEHFVNEISVAASESGLCAVGTVRVAMRTMLYANTMLMAVMSHHNDKMPKNRMETELRELLEQELAWADANIKGIDTIFAKDQVMKRTREHE